MEKAKRKEGQKSGPVIRVRLVFKDGKYHLRPSKAIDKMGLLQSIKLPDSDAVQGNYIELTDSKGKVLYRTNYEDVSDSYVSIPIEEGRSSMVKSNLKERNLEVLIPYNNAASSLTFYSSGGKNQKCEEVQRLSMEEIKKAIAPKNGKK